MDSKQFAYILEDHVPTAQFLHNVLKSIYPEIEISTFHSLRPAIHSIKNDGNAPLIALVDLGLPDGSGMRFIKELKKAHPKTPAIVVTIYGDDENLFNALEAGADGYVLKDEDQQLVSRTLERIKNEEPPLSPSIALRMINHFKVQKAPAESSDLTPRETETLQLIAKGLTVPEAAKKIGLSPQTVAGYVKNIYQKLHVSSRAEVTREAIKRRIV